MRWLVFCLLAGCATAPEFGTPTLMPTQVAELQARAQPASVLGVTMEAVPGGRRVANANTVAIAAPVTVPLARWPVADSDPSGRYRLPVVVATVNGRAGVRVLLDSGSNRNVVGHSLARRCAIPVVAGMPPLRAYGIGGAVDKYPAIIAAMQIGGLEVQRLLALVGPDAALLKLPGQGWGAQPTLVLGLNTLQSLAAVTIDYHRGAVTFWPGGEYPPVAADAVAAPLRWEGELPVADMLVDERVTVAAVLDTGGDYGMILPRALAAQLGYWQPGREKLAMSQGVGGAALAAQYKVRRARLGTRLLAEVPARTEVVGPEPSGGQVLLGNAVLRRYRVTFDFRKSQLWLE